MLRKGHKPFSATNSIENVRESFDYDRIRERISKQVKENRQNTEVSPP